MLLMVITRRIRRMVGFAEHEEVKNAANFCCGNIEN
jgi:hypothetical protein